MYAETVDSDVRERAVHVTDMSPEGRDLADSMSSALHNACLTSRDLDFVNAQEHLLRNTITWRRSNKPRLAQARMNKEKKRCEEWLLRGWVWLALLETQ